MTFCPGSAAILWSALTAWTAQVIAPALSSSSDATTKNHCQHFRPAYAARGGRSSVWPHHAGSILLPVLSNPPPQWLICLSACSAGERRDSHKPAEYLELKLDSQLNLARAQPVKGRGGGAAAGASPAGAAPTPRNTTATDADRMSLAKDILITPQGHTMQRSPQEFTIPAAYGPGAAQLGAAMQGFSVSATPRNTAAATKTL